jgi:hypothetical protein
MRWLYEAFFAMGDNPNEESDNQIDACAEEQVGQHVHFKS